MTNLEIGLVGVVFVLALVFAGMPVGLVLMVVSFVGLAAVRGINVADGILRIEPFDFSAHWSLSAIPMFLLMGAVAHHSGISGNLFVAARLWLERLPGGLAVATNFACAGFSAASGSSLATAAAMGRIALPEMDRAGYNKGLSTGVVASAGTLGSMIPPSVLLVIYGIFAEVSISQLFIAGILPGLLTASVYAAMIIARCYFNPALAPLSNVAIDWRARWSALAEVWPILILIAVIVIGLYTGIVTPTEAGAFGSMVAILIAAVRRRLTVGVLKESVLEAMSGTAKIFIVAIGAILFTRFLAFTGVASYFAELVGVLGGSPAMLMLVTAMIYVLLGMFLDPMGLLLLTLPILLPMYTAADMSLVWFGIIVVKFTEIALLTPPVGLNVYVVKGIASKDVTLDAIFRGVGWFLLCEVVVVLILFNFPQVSLFLPSMMK